MSTAINAPAALQSLSVREAVTDAIYRAVLGLDTDDIALFDSAFAPDGKFEIVGRPVKGQGHDELHKSVFNFISELDTTHFISNVRVEVKDGANTAYMTASALAQHYRPGEGNKPDTKRFLAGSQYWMDLVKVETEGLWKIADWKSKVVWSEGDSSVMVPPS